MAGYDNIKDKGLDVRTTEEVRKIASKGGKKSGEVRRRKRQMKDILDNIGSTVVPDEKIKEDIIKALGLNPKEVTFDVTMLFSAVREAVGGNIKAMEFIRDTRGQKPQERVQVEQIDASARSDIDEYIKNECNELKE